MAQTIELNPGSEIKVKTSSNEYNGIFIGFLELGGIVWLVLENRTLSDTKQLFLPLHILEAMEKPISAISQLNTIKPLVN